MHSFSDNKYIQIPVFFKNQDCGKEQNGKVIILGSKPND